MLICYQKFNYIILTKIHDRMLENGILASFMEKARKKKGFLLDFTEKPPKASGKTK